MPGHLEQTLKQALAQVDTLAQQEALLQAELAHLDSWEAQQKQKDLVQAQQAAQEAKQRADTLRGRLEAEHIPENDTIARLRGAIVNLETVRKSVDKARAERDEAMKQMLRAEAAVSESPFAGQSVEQVRREVASPPSGTPSYTAAAVLAVCGLLAAAALCWGLWSMGPLPALGCSRRGRSGICGRRLGSAPRRPTKSAGRCPAQALWHHRHRYHHRSGEYLL